MDQPESMSASTGDGLEAQRYPIEHLGASRPSSIDRLTLLIHRSTTFVDTESERSWRVIASE